VDRIKAEVGSTVDLSVLLVGGNGDVSIGTPEVDKARVVAEVLEHGRDRKILVFKYKNKTRYRRRHGHRQDYTRLQIKEIVTEAGSFTEAGEKPKRAAPTRRRKPKAEPVAEETPTTEAAAPEGTAEAGMPAAEAPTETETKPKRARRTPAKKPAEKTATAKKPATARRPRKAAPKAEAEEPKAEAEEPKAEETPQAAPEASEQPEETK
jgi:large subunit ribosomal protein L21